MNSSEDLVKSAMEEDQGVLGLRKCKERISGFLEQQEPPSGTQLAARRHTREVRGVMFTKNVVFVLFAQQEPSGGSLVLPGATSSLLGARRYHVFLVCAFFVKLHFRLLTV